ncbi:MAG: LLM class flavin-dependent oxidoreductase [Patulibacter sp.]
MASTAPRFGIWAIVHGGWATNRHPDDPFDPSFARNKRVLQLAEELDYDATLVAQHTINPLGDRDQLEAWTASAALAAVTSKIEIITAIKPYLYHPVVFAKQALQVDEISAGRSAINVVNAWFKPELERAGIGFPEHDERYAYGEEWLTIVRRLISGEEVTFHGKWFNIDGYRLRPASKFRERPTIYVGGESDPAKELVARQADVWFINGQPPHEIDRLIGDVQARPRPTGEPPVRFGLSAYVIARETEAEAKAVEQEFWGYAELDAADNAHVFANADEKAVMFKTFAKYPAIGTNGGTAAGLVGSYDQVAERIAAFHAQGIELFMLQFQPLEAEMRRFAEHVAPRARALAATPATA